MSTDTIAFHLLTSSDVCFETFQARLQPERGLLVLLHPRPAIHHRHITDATRDVIADANGLHVDANDAIDTPAAADLDRAALLAVRGVLVPDHRLRHAAHDVGLRAHRRHHRRGQVRLHDNRPT